MCRKIAASSLRWFTRKRWTCFNPGDVVILATPPAFRWVHFTYAIEKGLNVFMEKPVTIDGPGSRKMLELAQKSVEKNLKVASADVVVTAWLAKSCMTASKAVRSATLS